MENVSHEIQIVVLLSIRLKSFPINPIMARNAVSLELSMMSSPSYAIVTHFSGGTHGKSRQARPKVVTTQRIQKFPNLHPHH